MEVVRDLPKVIQVSCREGSRSHGLVITDFRCLHFWVSNLRHLLKGPDLQKALYIPP